jgi:hypothetical protein
VSVGSKSESFRDPQVRRVLRKAKGSGDLRRFQTVRMS